MHRFTVTIIAARFTVYLLPTFPIYHIIICKLRELRHQDTICLTGGNQKPSSGEYKQYILFDAMTPMQIKLKFVTSCLFNPLTLSRFWDHIAMMLFICNICSQNYNNNTPDETHFKPVFTISPQFPYYFTALLPLF